MTPNRAAVEQPITSGTDLNTRDPYGGSSPLMTAALLGKTEIAKLFLEAGAALNVQNNEGSTALHAATFFCRTALVTLLLAKGADRTLRNQYGDTANDTVRKPFSEVEV